MRTVLITILACTLHAEPANAVRAAQLCLPGSVVMSIAPTSSMYPCLTGESLVLVRPVPFASITKGDVIVFRRRQQLVCHRVVRVGKDGLRTKGDACRDPDSMPVTSDNYVGRVEAIFH